MDTATVASEKLAKAKKETCYHCGQACEDDYRVEDEHAFCCLGCQLVYRLLQDNQLDSYYQLENQPGTKKKEGAATAYDFLDDREIQFQLLDYHDEQRHQLKVRLPQIHCSACVWLLEHLYDLLPGVLSSRVNFVQRTATIAYDPAKLSLRQVCEMLDRIGYAPDLDLNQGDEKQKDQGEKQLYYRLGVAGFAFGNIMLLSFPEYLGLTDPTFARWFGYLNLLLSLPVLLYSARDYWQSAYWSLRQGRLNIDVPITLGMLALFSRSAYGILTHTDAGYLDSMAGLVFFLLIGKWFQQRTYRHLSFERDYTAYFPLAVRVKTGASTVTRPLQKISIGDTLVLKNGELIPADSILLNGPARIDYSFVTGEAEPIHCKIGEQLFAGGRQQGGVIELSVIKTVSQSYLTQLWNDSAFTQEEQPSTLTADRVGRWFTYFILAVALGSLFYWLPQDSSKAINAFSAVLIIACPCAIALSIPFIYGNMLRWFGRSSFYLKHTNVVEGLQRVTAIVFDKTGTLTVSKDVAIEYQGIPLSEQEKQWVTSVASASEHPLSRQLAGELSAYGTLTLDEFREVPGAGTEARITEHTVRLGSADFMQNRPDNEPVSSCVHVEIDGQTRGVYTFQHALRPGVTPLLQQLQPRYQTYLLSGDRQAEAERFAPHFTDLNHLHFQQQPQDKLDFIRQLQEQGAYVMMIGDGLNDAGALRQADVGLVVTDDTNNFSPACDGILEGSQLPRLTDFLRFAQSGKIILYASYALALMYNVIGLSFAVQALLSPVIAAILMPLSSVTIVAFGVLMSNLAGQRMIKVTTTDSGSH